MRIRLTIGIVIGLATPAGAQSAAATPTAAVTTPQPPAKTGEPAGYTYQSGGRRDPFVSLLRGASEDRRSSTALRAPGLGGLGAAEVTLKGTLRARDGYVAILLGADNKTYIVRPGDRLEDGAIRTIAADSLVIVQQVNDPLSPQKQREVRKMLRQTEEVK